MQVLVRDSDRGILQVGRGVAERAGATIIEVSAAAETLIRESLDQPNSGITLNVDLTVTVTPPEPPPIRYAGREEIETHVQTIGANAAELIRLPLTLVTAYGAIVELFAIDAVNGVTKSWYFRSVLERLNGGAIAIGPRQDIVPPVQTPPGAPATAAGVASWAITPALSGNDAVISAVGFAGRTVDWFAFVALRRFTPGGMT